MREEGEEGNYFDFVEKGRRMVLEKNRNRREEIFNSSRQIFMRQFHEGDGESFNSSQSEQSELPFFTGKSITIQSHLKKENKLIKSARLFQIPDWMNSVPEMFHEYYVAAKPAGISGLLKFSHEAVVGYNRQGKKMLNLPNPLQQWHGSILQIVFDKTKGTIYILDVISLQENIVTTQPFKNRMELLVSFLQDLGIGNLPMLMINYLPVNVGNVQNAYLGQDCGYEKDGLIFVHQDSFYIHGVNSNVLLWKDLSSNPQISQNPYFYGIGRIKGDGSVFTSDDVLLGKPGNLCHIIGKPKGMIKYRIQGIEFKNEGSKFGISFEKLEVIGFKGFSESIGDPLGSLLFQYRLKYNPLGIQEILSRLQQFQ